MNTLWTTVASGVGTLVGLGLHGALLAVTLTVVRRHKPSAVVPLALAAGIDLLTTILIPLVYAIVPALVHDSLGGVDGFSVLFAAISLGSTLIHVVSGVLLIVGVAKLATPDSPARFPA